MNTEVKKKFSIIHLLYVCALVASAISYSQMYGVLATVAVCWCWHSVFFANSNPKLRLIDAVVIVTGLLLIVFLMLPSEVGQSTVNSVKCRNNLKQISLALQEYEAVYGSFPPPVLRDTTGAPIHSWRVLILPFLHEQRLYQEYDFSQAWNGPDNHQLIARMPAVYRCPEVTWLTGTTNYCVVIDDQSCFPDAGCRKKTDIVDGLQNTLAIVEDGGRSIPWTAPQDPTMDQFLAEVATWAKTSRPKHMYRWGVKEYYLGDYASTMDGSTLLLDSSAVPQLMRSVLDISDGSGAIEIQAISVSKQVQARIQFSKLFSLVAFFFISLAPGIGLLRIKGIQLSR